MDGLFNLCGRRNIDLTAHGKTYKLAVRTLADYALKEAAILAVPGNPYAGAEAIENDQHRAQAIKAIAEIAARPRIATLPDEHRFDNSMRGIAYTLWRALSVNHPEEFPATTSVSDGIQLAMDFIEWFGIDRFDEIIEAVTASQEDDIVKNSVGQMTEPEADQSPAA